jgi:flagellar L-ring protein precursor FlgH
MKNALFTLILAGLLLASFPANAQRSLYRDLRANQVGDIITVVLMENISGSSTRDSRTATSSGGQASGSVGGNFIPFQPTMSGDIGNAYNNEDRFLNSQQQLLQGNMSVRIIEVTSGGDLIVLGTRMTEINGELHEVKLTGTIRPRDIDSMNRIPSFRVADAEISYQKKGGIRQATRRPGLARRLIYYGVGATLGAAIVVRELQK